MLTAISARWFDFIRQRKIIADHLISIDPSDVPDLAEEDRPGLQGRIMIGRAAQVIPIEFVVRGYLAGSGWAEYERSRSICGVALPAGNVTAQGTSLGPPKRSWPSWPVFEHQRLRQA